MSPIQILLLVLLVLGVLVYLRFLRSRSRDRLFVLLVVAAGAMFVVMPGWATVLANKLGVGRGVDLLMYLALLLLGFLTLVLYSQQRHLRQQMTLLARETAIAHAKRPGSRKLPLVDEAGREIP